MKVKHLNFGGPVNFIEVRNYSNVIVNVSQSLKPDNSEFCSGFWRVKDKEKGCKHIQEVRKNIN